jgi:hypothetical protein
MLLDEAATLTCHLRDKIGCDFTHDVSTAENGNVVFTCPVNAKGRVMAEMQRLVRENGYEAGI